MSRRSRTAAALAALAPRLTAAGAQATAGSPPRPPGQQLVGRLERLIS